MKRIIMFVLLFAALKVAGQTTGYFRYDTVRIMKQNGTCELYIINKTKDSLGLLTNVGGGLTRFIKSKMLNDSTIIIGMDTITIRGASGGGADHSIATGSRTATGNYTQNWNQHQLYIDTVPRLRFMGYGNDLGFVNNKHTFLFEHNDYAPGTILNLKWALRNVTNSYDSTGSRLVSDLYSTYLDHYGSGGSKDARITLDGPNGTVQLYAAGSKTSTITLDNGVRIEPADSLQAKITPAATADSVLGVRAYGFGLNTIVKFPASAIGGGSATLSNVGSGYRLVKTAAGQIKTLFGGYGITPDSSSNTDALTFKADTSSTNHLVTQSDLNDTAAALRSSMGGSITFPDGLVASTSNTPRAAKDSDVVNVLHDRASLLHHPFRCTPGVDSIFIYGDSYVYGAMASTGQKWSTIFCRRMNAIEVNYGVASSTLEKRSPVDWLGATNMIDRLSNVPTKSYRTKLLIFAFGLNDIGQNGANYNVTNYKADYDSVMHYCMNKGWAPNEILIIPPYYIGQAGYDVYASVSGNAAPTPQRHRDFVQATQDVAAKWNTLYFDLYNEQLRNDTTLISVDHIHPTDDGYAFIEYCVSKYMGAQEQVIIGPRNAGSTSTPLLVDLGRTYADEVGNPAKLKLGLYTDYATPTNNFGFEVSNNNFGIHAGGPSTKIRHYINGSGPILTIEPSGIDVGTIGGITMSNKPSAVSIGQLYDGVLGDTVRMKLKVIDAQTATDTIVAGFNVASTDGTNFYFENQVPWDYNLDWRIGPSSKMRMPKNGNLLLNTTSDNGIGKLQVNGKATIATIDSASSPANMLWQDPATGEIKKAAPPSGATPYSLLYSDTSTTTVGNTTTETSLVGNVIGSTSINGSTITAGTRIIQKGYGIISTKASSPGNISFNFTVSNFTLGINSNVPASLTNAAFEYEYEATPFATGTNQDIFYKGKITIYDNVGAIAYANSFNGKGTMTTTGTLTSDMTVQWVTADASNTITSRSNTLEVFRLQ